MSSPTDNPYASPPEADAALPTYPPADSAKEVFLAWEKLRLIYNCLLAVVSLSAGYAWLGVRDIIDFLTFLFEGAIGANLCFCLGPVIEGYLSLMGVNRRKVRLLLFVLGTLIACMFAAAALASWLMII
jgi:hypothetical protein